MHTTRNRSLLIFVQIPIASLCYGLTTLTMMDVPIIGNSRVLAQPIVPEPNSTGTLVHPNRTPQNNQRWDITGGKVSGDGHNLFQSFTKFNVPDGQTANFMSPPQIQNIIARVKGGEPSLINGLIQVTGSQANLFLMNPAGIIFGNNARLDVPNSFVATTATGIGFNSGWLSAIESNDYQSLIGTPNAFNFSGASGSIINSGNLSVNPQASLSLLGGITVNTGTLSAPGGNITVASVPGEHLVRLSQEGHLLSIELSNQKLVNNAAFSPLSIPEMLTGGTIDQATGLSLNSQGQVILTATNSVIPTTPGTTIVSGQLSVNNPQVNQNQTVNILGNKIGLFQANIDGSGQGGGGIIRIGGDFRGLGNIDQADITYIDRNSIIKADGLNNSNGGQVVIWAKETTGFFGEVSATGNQGGFVEISGKKNLLFDGKVNTLGQNGATGTLLLDPLNITIVDDSQGTNDAEISSGTIFSNQLPSESLVISQKALENLAGDTNIILEATNDFKISNLADGVLSLQSIKGTTVTFSADADRDGTGSFTMENPANLIETKGGTVAINGRNLLVGNIKTNGGNIELEARGDAMGQGSSTAGDLNTSDLAGSAGNITLNSPSGISVGSIDASGMTAGGNATLTTAGDITATKVTTTSSGNSGLVKMTSTGGNVTVSQDIDTSSTSGNAGAITINAAKDLSVSNINSNGVGGGDINLTGNDLDFTGGIGSIKSNGNLLIQAASGTQNIILGAPDESLTGLNLTATELAALADSFSSITIGETSSNANINVAGDMTFRYPLILQTGTGAITGSGNITGTDNSTITVKSGNGITLSGGITTSNKDITLESKGAIETGLLQIENSTSESSGKVNIKGSSDIKITEIRTNSGEVNVTTTNGNVTVNEGIDTSNPNGTGGNITVTTDTGIADLNNLKSSGDRAGNMTITASTINLGKVESMGVSSFSDLTFNADEINFIGGKNSITGNGNLFLQQNLATQEINLGSSSETAALDLTTTDLDSLNNGLQKIYLGKIEGTGNITISNNISFQDPVIIRSPAGGNMTGTGTITGYDNATIEIMMNGDITLDNIYSSAGINLTSIQGKITTGELSIIGNSNLGETSGETLKAGLIEVKSIGDIKMGNISTRAENGRGSDVTITSSAGKITTGNIDTSGGYGGGNIRIYAVGAGLISGAINTSSLSKNAGEVILQSGGDIEVSSIQAEGGVLGGNVDISTQGFFRAKETFNSQNQLTASVSTAGKQAGGLFKLQYGVSAAGTNIFTVGDATKNGSSGVITDGQVTISPGTSITGNFDLRQAANSQSTTSQSSDSTTNQSSDSSQSSDSTTNQSSDSSQSSDSTTNQSSDSTTNQSSDSTTNQSSNTTTNQSSDSSQSSNTTTNQSSDSSQSTTNPTETGKNPGQTPPNDGGNSTNTENQNNPNTPTTSNPPSVTTPQSDSGTTTTPENPSPPATTETGTTAQTVVVTPTIPPIPPTPTPAVTPDNNVNSPPSNAAPTTANPGVNPTSNPPNNAAPTTANPGVNPTSNPPNNAASTTENPGVNPTSNPLAGNTNNGVSSAAINAPNPNIPTTETTNNNAVNNSTVSVTPNPVESPKSAVNPEVVQNVITPSVTATNPNQNIVDNSNPTTLTNTVIGPTVPDTITTDNPLVKPPILDTSSVSGLPSVDPKPPNPNPPVPPVSKQITQLPTPSPTPILRTDIPTKIKQESAHRIDIDQVRLTELGQIDNSRSSEFKKYFGTGINPEINTINPTNIRDELKKIAESTRMKPAIIYVELQDNELQLRLFLPNGKPIYKSLPISRETIQKAAQEFISEIRNSQQRQTKNYQFAGEELYSWLIEPLEQDLEENGVKTLLFSMDMGLRSLPIAALYDGEKFLVEKYSLAMIPSLSLTDMSYVNIRNSKVLALGASAFPASENQTSLPAVPLEIAAIFGSNGWQGKSLLNQDFTVEKLTSARKEGGYKIIHLATHGEFQSGGASNSYIQFWNRKLMLNQLRELQLNNPPVDLLVLSACRTALGDEENVEMGFAGLAVQAGVKSALASLWYVSDTGTLGLMTEFYQQLRKAPIKAEALRKAQLAMLHGKVRLEGGRLYYSGAKDGRVLPNSLPGKGDRNLSHPYYWAGFTMIGSPW